MIRKSNTNRIHDPRVIVQTTEPSGLAPYVSSLVVSLAGVGIPVVLFCPGNFEYESEVRQAGAEVVHTAERETSIAGLAGRVIRNLKFVAKAAATQKKLVRSGDVIHFQSLFHLPVGLLFLLLARMNGASVVLTAHDPLPHRWRLPRSLRWLDRKMLQLAYHICDCIIVHNEIGKTVLQREFRVRNERIAVVPHGPYSVPVRQPLPPFDSLRLLAFGAIRKNKGLHLGIQALQEAVKQSTVPITLTIAGRVQNAAEQQYWEECKRLIECQPEAITVIEGLVPEADVPALMASHHAVLLPYEEFYSESGVGALACSHGRPIIATGRGGLGELMERSSCGIRIASATVNSVREAIMTAIKLGPEQLKEMGVRGRHFVSRQRSWESIAQMTAKVYSSIAQLDFPPKAAVPTQDRSTVSGISC